ncbi:MAG TPA: YqiA/YcfP family alpha/beta fold hydrolase [Candidatus Marinimicrobia bacterium]|nr:YqiA/YcfP family alpha/beta fold hydrolase [Candidatus Neomarinimicrobiota bacterium]HRU92000.1 YqiA/YcfP family alpha/beta fold hydrolase [Candidatus Neomarinimicrobiota bacterium]
MLIYCHGFGSSGQATKAQILRAHFTDKMILAPDLPLEPAAAIETIIENIRKAGNDSRILLVGSSLGGFYALHLNQEYGFPAILLNPTVDPIGDTYLPDDNPGEIDNSPLAAWCQKFTSEIRALYHSPQTINPQNLFVFLNRDDELLDYRKAAEYFRVNNCQVIISESGGHRFLNFEELIPTIRAIYENLPPANYI